MNNRITRTLARMASRPARAVIEKRPPDFIVGDIDDPYLERWWIIPRNRLFNIYLHRFLRDDDDRALHDHPWASLSLTIGRNSLMSGSDESAVLREVYAGKDGEQIERTIPFGTFIYRGARFTHRLSVPRPGVMTIFFTGPLLREWGFSCPNGWRHWKDFTGYRTGGGKGAVGPGCD